MSDHEWTFKYFKPLYNRGDNRQKVSYNRTLVVLYFQILLIVAHEEPF